MSDAQDTRLHDWQRTGVAQAHCARCGAHAPIWREREPGPCRGALTLPANPPDIFELELDPFERIELAAAEWRNAYRARERGDQARLIEHSMRAVAHTLRLSAGLR